MDPAFTYILLKGTVSRDFSLMILTHLCSFFICCNIFPYCLKFAEIFFVQKTLRCHWYQGVKYFVHNICKSFFSNLKRQFPEIFDTVFYESNLIEPEILGLEHFWVEVQFNASKIFALIIFKLKKSYIHTAESELIFLRISFGTF